MVEENLQMKYLLITQWGEGNWESKRKKCEHVTDSEVPSEISELGVCIKLI